MKPYFCAALLLVTILPAVNHAVAADASPPPAKPTAPEAERFVVVSGQVKREGRVLFSPKVGMTLLEAIGGAEGHTRFADLRAIRITRTYANGQSVTFVVDANPIMRGQQGDLPLFNGDRIVIPDRQA